MANFRREIVGYRKLELEHEKPQGLLAVARVGGELEAKVAAAFFRLAEQQGEIARAQAHRSGQQQARRDFMAGMPSANIESDLPADGPGASPSGPPSRARGGRFAPEVTAAIDTAAQRHGVDRSVLFRIAQLESGGNPNAKNARSSAGGLFQFVDSTARQYGLTNKFDPHQSADAAARLLKDNAAQLRKALGREPTAGELYLAHQQGAGGAIKLLRNPDAKASSVVGASVVSNNGGLPGMTAGEFAQMWIRRAESGYVLPSTAPNQTASPSTGSSPRIALAGGTWRPSGSDTIYGRAYDAEGSRLYLQRLELETRKTLAQAYELYKDNPSEFAKATDILKRDMLRQHVFEEIAPEFELAFESQRATYQLQVDKNRADAQKQQLEQEFETRSSELATDLERQIAGLDPSIPGVEAAIANAQAALDAHYDSAVSTGLITAQQAEIAKKKSHSDTAVKFYLRQAELLQPQEISDMHKRMEQDFAAGRLTGIDAEGWRRLKSGLQDAEAGRKAEIKQAKAAVEDEATRLADRALAGFDITQDELTRFVIQAGDVGDDSLVAGALIKIEAAEAMRDLPLREAAKIVEKIRESLPRDASDAEIAAVAFAEQRLQQLADLAAKDPAAYEIQRGRLKLEPIQLSSPEAMDASLSIRRDQMREVSERYGRSVSIFRPGEVEALSRAIMENPESFPEFAASVAGVFGADAGKVLSEIAPEMPVLAHAAGVMAATGDRSLAVDLATAISAKQKGLWKAKMPNDEKFMAAAAPLLGTSLSFMDATRSSVLAAAQILFERDANLLGFNPADVNKPDSAAYASVQRAINRALGAQLINGIQTGGIGEVNGQRIIVPTGMPVERPQQLLSGLTDKQLEALPPIATANGVKITASALRSGNLITIGDGLYRVALGDPNGWDPRYVLGEDGKFWTLDLRQLEKADGGRSTIRWMPSW